MSDERLKYQIEMQATQIREVLARHDVEAQVAGGVAARDRARFELPASLVGGLERLRALTDDLKQTLRVPEIAISAEEDAWQLDVTQADPPPVALLDLLDLLPPLPPVTAVLGWAEDEQPLVLNLRQPEMAHVLVAGGPRAGKSALLQTIALSLALLNRQSHLQLIVLDPNREDAAGSATSLQHLNYLPHLLSPVEPDVTAAADLLSFLIGELDYRRGQATSTPAIVTVIDNLDVLLAQGGQPVKGPLTRLLQHGAAYGLHVIAAVRDPASPALDNVVRASLPVRLVGQVADGRAAQRATGLSQSGAEGLLGEGDFLAVVRDASSRFQAAFMSDADLGHCLDQLHRPGRHVLVAQPFDSRPHLVVDDDREYQRQFVVGENGALSMGEFVRVALDDGDIYDDDE